MSRALWLKGVVDGAEAARKAGARVNPAGAAAHAANETGYGNSQLGKPPHHNLFGVKATGAWRGKVIELPTWEVVNGKRVDIMAPWRSYDSYEACFMDYADIIGRLYPNAKPEHPVAFLRGLFLTGPRFWATDPLAFDKACRILGEWWKVLESSERSFTVTRVVLHDLEPADGVAVFDTLMARKSETALRGSFVGRVRADEMGGRIDVRREE